MKVKVVREHHVYPLGEVEVDDARGNYMLRCGIAVPVEDHEKKEVKHTKEKHENVKHTAKKEK